MQRDHLSGVLNRGKCIGYSWSDCALIKGFAGPGQDSMCLRRQLPKSDARTTGNPGRSTAI